MCNECSVCFVFKISPPGGKVWPQHWLSHFIAATPRRRNQYSMRDRRGETRKQGCHTPVSQQLCERNGHIQTSNNLEQQVDQSDRIVPSHLPVRHVDNLQAIPCTDKSRAGAGKGGKGHPSTDGGSLVTIAPDTVDLPGLTVKRSERIPTTSPVSTRYSRCTETNVKI